MDERDREDARVAGRQQESAALDEISEGGRSVEPPVVAADTAQWALPSIQTLAWSVTSLSAAFCNVSIFLQKANLVTEFPNSGRE